MNIELSNQELDILVTAVELWEKDPQSSRVFGSIFSAMLGPREGMPGYEESIQREKDASLKSEREVEQRKLTSLRLRSKLLEFKMRPQEFANAVPVA